MSCLTSVSRQLQALSDALSCLGLPDDPHAYLHTPKDREAHLTRLHAAIEQLIPTDFPIFCWLTSCGPWLEDIWLNMRFLPASEFGAFIPLFVPWVALWGLNGSANYVTMIQPIFALLSPDYLYVTLSHNDDGLEGTNRPIPPLPRNLLVLSQGGKGHVPLLLWLNEVSPDDFANRYHYKYDLIFMGGDGTHWIRSWCKHVLRKLEDRAFWGYDIDWADRIQQAKFVLAPRGYGRNSYRLSEILMRGLLPVYVYNDIVWLPYYDSINWSSFAIVVRWDRLNETFQYMREMPAYRVNQMRNRVRELYQTHFSINAVFNQVFKFLKGGWAESDLRCAIYSSRTNVPGQETMPEWADREMSMDENL